jgi:hypothetical protein
VGNKLVTIFARHRDNFIMTQNLSVICQIRFFRLWTIPATGTTLSFAGTGKNCAMVSCPPGLILPKVPGHVSADGTTIAYYLHQPAVSIQARFAPYRDNFSYRDNYVTWTDGPNANRKGGLSLDGRDSKCFLTLTISRLNKQIRCQALNCSTRVILFRNFHYL